MERVTNITPTCEDMDYLVESLCTIIHSCGEAMQVDGSLRNNDRDRGGSGIFY